MDRDVRAAGLEGVGLRALGDGDDPARAVDEEHVEWDQRVLHPEAHPLRRIEEKQHAGVEVEVLAEHEPSGTLLGRSSHLGTKEVLALGGGDDHRYGRWCFGSGRGHEHEPQTHEPQRQKRSSMSHPHAPDLRRHIRVVPDFPKPGIQFYDISTLLAHAGAWRTAIGAMSAETEPFVPDRLVAIESRGFIFAAPIAVELGLGMTLVRKRGKLPGRVHSHAYELEYGNDVVEVSADLIMPGEKVVVVDDLIATGGTCKAAIDLLARVGVETLGCVFLMELMGLGGVDKLGVPCRSILQLPA